MNIRERSMRKKYSVYQNWMRDFDNVPISIRWGINKNVGVWIFQNLQGWRIHNLIHMPGGRTLLEVFQISKYQKYFLFWVFKISISRISQSTQPEFLKVRPTLHWFAEAKISWQMTSALRDDLCTLESVEHISRETLLHIFYSALVSRPHFSTSIIFLAMLGSD